MLIVSGEIAECFHEIFFTPKPSLELTGSVNIVFE